MHREDNSVDRYMELYKYKKMGKCRRCCFNLRRNYHTYATCCVFSRLRTHTHTIAWHYPVDWTCKLYIVCVMCVLVYRRSKAINVVESQMGANIGMEWKTCTSTITFLLFVHTQHVYEIWQMYCAILTHCFALQPLFSTSLDGCYGWTLRSLLSCLHWCFQMYICILRVSM